ncbi:uncharacterized protein LOC143357683 isoform X2 [Halictus rubicundus]|uniref:uncharacterized protein LOC143357683 isoform X2 n=1 Tax=Halictus rubicundus TaxID=77578 RepID=UPI00403706AB
MSCRFCPSFSTVVHYPSSHRRDYSKEEASMTLEWFYVTLTAFAVWMYCLNLSMGEPFPENTMVLPSRKFLKSSAVSPVSVFAETKRNNERNGNDHTAKRKGGTSDKSSVVNDVKLLYRLPPSPANLLKPDGFQFYTYNERGDMITKQMTPQEIQALIASGGPDHSNIGVQEPQKAEDILTGGKKVMDVVEKVQNVLKSAMNKPPTLTGTISNSVPEKANVEWSNILPVILAGDKHGDVADDTRYVERFTTTPTIRSSTVRNDYTLENAFATAFTTTAGLDNGIKFAETTPHGFGENRTRQTTSTTLTISTSTANTPTETEKFMIPVAVITAEQKPQAWRSTTQSPIFQKITEILPSTNVVANVENYNDNSNRLSSDGIDSVKSNVSTVPVDATKTNVLPTVSVVSAIVESTTSIVYSSTGQTKPASAVADTSDTSTTWTTSTTPNVATEPTSSISASKAEAPIINVNSSFATTPFYSPSVTPATGTDQISTAGPSSVLQQEIKPTVSTSLSMELINSLSSMIGQVSEISVSSILPISTDFQGQSSHNEVEGKNRENNSEMWKSATASSPIDVPIKLPTTDGGAALPSMADTYDEPIEDSVAGTASTMLPRIDQDRVTWSIPPVASTNSIHSVGGINFTSTWTTFPDDHATPNSTLSEKYTDSTETAITEGPLGATTNATPVTLRTVVKPFDSMKTNSTDFKSSSKISDVIESMLETVSTEANNIRSTEPLALPNLPSEILPPKTLASGLITGYEFTDTNRNVTAVVDTDVPLKLEVHSRLPSATEISTNGSSTNKNANETIYVKLITPSNPAKGPGTFETTTTVSTTRVENNATTLSKDTNDIPTTDSSVSGVAASIDAFTDRAKVSSSENIHYTTTVSSKESSVFLDSKQSISHGTTNVDEITEPSSIITKLEEIPLEAFKKDDTTSATDSDRLDGISSTESIVQVVHDTSTTFDRSSTNEPTSTDTSVDAVDPTIDSIAIVADITVTDASILPTNKETNNSSNTTIDTPSTNLPNKTNSVDVDSSKNETTTESIYPLTGTESKWNITRNVSTNETDKFESLYPSATNTTDDGNFDDKWQRITLHETVATSPTKSTTSTTTTATTTTTAAAATTTTTATTTLSMHETNSTENDTRYQTTPNEVSETSTTVTVTLNPSKSTGGLDSSTKNASNDIVNFSRLCNELALKFWIAANKGLSTGRSLALSPFGMVSLLAMIFLGARGSTSDQMNEVLGLDNVVTFNPHLIFQNVTDAVSLARNQGIANAAFVRELFADKVKIRKLLPFYKEQAHQFYEGLVAEVNFATISDLARRRTNLLIRKQTGGRIRDFVKSNAVPLRSPLAAISANVFQTDCNTSSASTTGRDGELYFAVSSAHRLRKLIPVPATVWRSNVLAGYEPSLDATAIGLGGADKLVSTIFLLPGQQGHAAPGDTLDRLEQRLVKGAFRDDTWNKLLKVLIPRRGLELQIPKFSHRSVVNATAALKRMGLDRLFSHDADFKGINGIGNRLFLSDIVQMNLFSTCGDENTANGRHHVEIYPASPLSRESSSHDYQHRSLDLDGRQLDSDSVAPTFDFRAKNHPRTVSTSGTLSGVSEKQTEDRPRLKLDQPFLYFVRHNPTGLILHMGRFNPRLL